MKYPISEAQALELVGQVDDDGAHDLIAIADKNFERRFSRLTTGLVKLLDDIRYYFPDATYYTASGGLHVLLGEPHSVEGIPQPQLTALDANTKLIIGDGDF